MHRCFHNPLYDMAVEGLNNIPHTLVYMQNNEFSHSLNSVWFLNSQYYAEKNWIVAYDNKHLSFFSSAHMLAPKTHALFIIKHKSPFCFCPLHSKIQQANPLVWYESVAPSKIINEAFDCNLYYDIVPREHRAYPLRISNPYVNIPTSVYTIASLTEIVSVLALLR